MTRLLAAENQGRKKIRARGCASKAFWILLLLATMGCSADAFLEPEEAGIDYRLQGEYVSADGHLAAQVVASGDGEFSASLLRGGLPGAGWDGRRGVGAEGTREDESLSLTGAWSALVSAGVMQGRSPEAGEFTLTRVVRTSPSEGMPPSQDAVLLFDGQVRPALAEGEADARGLLAVPARTRDPYQDFRLHVEFRTPFMPDSSTQARGNSGIYLQERYEVQILDSFGLPTGNNTCGSLYLATPPSVNMAYPPLQWQTYDIDFRAARYSEDGIKQEPARVSVRHNGVLIQDDVVLTGPTGRGEDEGPEARPILLQDHWDPVFYRNVWLVEE